MDKNSDLYEAEMKGELRGKMEGKLEAARNALLEGLEPQTVAKITGLPLETIQQIKAELFS
jgi:predicted transposase/invertase (TIGR01784 family)